MRLTRLLTALLVPALLGLPVVALGASPATARATLGTTLQVKRAPATQVYGSNIQVAGRLTSSGTPKASQTVRLERRASTGAAFKSIDSGFTDSNGVVSFYAKATGNAKFRVVFDGGTDSASNTLSPSTSAVKISKVMRDMNATYVPKGKNVVYKGNVNPGYGHKVVKLQRKTCKSCAWRAYGKTRTAANGAWKFRVGGPRKGSWYYRANAPKNNKKFVKSYAATLRVYPI